VGGDAGGIQKNSMNARAAVSSAAPDLAAGSHARQGLARVLPARVPAGPPPHPQGAEEYDNADDQQVQRPSRKPAGCGGRLRSGAQGTEVKVVLIAAAEAAGSR
jgi:hypothetical protein